MTSTLATEALPNAAQYLAALRRREAQCLARRTALLTEARDVRRTLTNLRAAIAWLAPLAESGGAQ